MGLEMCQVFRKHPLNLMELPKLKDTDPDICSYFSSDEPVIIRDSQLVSNANGWDLDYLSNMPGQLSVILSRDHKFMYYDETKTASFPGFEPSTRRVRMKFDEFVHRMNKWKPGDERLYLQQIFDAAVGLDVLRDFSNFRWSWIKQIQKQNKWGPLTSNLIMVSMGGNVTPCHYDEQHNIFAQIKGHKRIILFPPSSFNKLYPYPTYHPYDRQCQVDLENPDYERFPNFENIVGYETIISPGEILYIPAYWFHHIESSINDAYTVSINFWYKIAPTGQVMYPLKDRQKVVIMRNVEKMLAQVLRDPVEIGPLLKTIIDGRYEV